MYTINVYILTHVKRPKTIVLVTNRVPVAPFGLKLRMNPTASGNPFKPLPALREPIFGPKTPQISKSDPPAQPPYIIHIYIYKC